MRAELAFLAVILALVTLFALRAPNTEVQNVVPEPPEEPKEAPPEITEDTMQPIVVLETSKGNIEIELYPEEAPLSVKNFLQYVDDGFYTGTLFHRIIKGFMIQTGGFTLEGKKATRQPIPIESKNGLKNDMYTVAMARTSDPNSATSQFYINTVDNDMLNYAPGNDGYAVFGKVIKGEDVVKAIERIPTQNQPMPDFPSEQIMITKAYRKE